MTVQVGLVTDRVIASYGLLQQYENGQRSVGLVSKIVGSAGVTYCHSGDTIAEYAAGTLHP
jgi:hypothetical protein